MAAIDKAVELLNRVVDDYYASDDTSSITHLVQDIESWLLWYDKQPDPRNNPNYDTLYRITSNTKTCNGCVYNGTLNDDLCGTCGPDYKHHTPIK
jgi:hypothetical protein